MDAGQVRPSKHVPEGTIKLTLCDVYAPKVWDIQTHFWPLDSQTSPATCYEIFKQGLSRTLSEIPALAGTVHQLSADPKDVVIRVDQDPHVDFPLEDLTSRDGVPSYAELRANGFAMTNLVRAFAQPITLGRIYDGCSTFTAKLNVLEGGLALTFGINHLLADAATGSEVERIWSQHAQDVSSGTSGRHKPEVDDQNIRQRLSSPVPGAEPFSSEDWAVLPAHLPQLSLPKAPTPLEQLTTVTPASSSDLSTHWCIWYLSPTSLAQLKQNATKVDTVEWISTYDALCGLFWSRLIAAKGLAGQAADTSKVFMSIDIRQRLQPSIHPQYVGNAVDMVTTDLPTSELLSEVKGLSDATYAVRRAIASWSQSRWDSWLTASVSLSDQVLCPSPAALLAPQNLGVSDCSKMQTHVMEWGPELGRIERTRYMMPASSVANSATIMIVHPRLSDGGLEVSTAITTATRDALLKDNVFSSYAEPVCTW